MDNFFEFLGGVFGEILIIIFVSLGVEKCNHSTKSYKLKSSYTDSAQKNLELSKAYHGVNDSAFNVSYTNASPSLSGIPTELLNSSGAAPVPPSPPSTVIKSGMMSSFIIALQMEIN